MALLPGAEGAHSKILPVRARAERKIYLSARASGRPGAAIERGKPAWAADHQSACHEYPALESQWYGICSESMWDEHAAIANGVRP